MFSAFFTLGKPVASENPSQPSFILHPGYGMSFIFVSIHSLFEAKGGIRSPAGAFSFQITYILPRMTIKPRSENFLWKLLTEALKLKNLIIT